MDQRHPDTVHATIRTGQGTAVRVATTYYAGRWRLDIRQHFEFRPGDADTLRPTRKGVSVRLEDLPALAAAVAAAERAAIARGLLEREDYERAGLDVPGTLEARDRDRGAA